MLEDLRKEIDIIDKQLVELIAKRIEVVKKIGIFKRQNNLQVVDEDRFNKVLEKVKHIALKKSISTNFIDEIYNIIHKYSCEVEK